MSNLEKYDVEFEVSLKGQDFNVHALHEIDDLDNLNDVKLIRVERNGQDVAIDSLDNETQMALIEAYHRSRLMSLGEDLDIDFNDDVMSFIDSQVDDLMSDIGAGFSIQPGG